MKQEIAEKIHQIKGRLGMLSLDLGMDVSSLTVNQALSHATEYEGLLRGDSNYKPHSGSQVILKRYMAIWEEVATKLEQLEVLRKELKKLS